MTNGKNEIALRDFRGVNLEASREAIADGEFYWLENIIPLGASNLLPTSGALFLSTVAGESGAPSYTCNFNVNGTDYIFALWKNSGNGYVGVTAGPWTKIITGLTSGKTQAAQWNDTGLLIIDPTGYWDWNVTTASTLTSLSNSISSGTITTRYLPGSTTMRQQVATGNGGVVQCIYGVAAAAVSLGGTGYVVGDLITLTDGNPTTEAVLQVATIGGGGAIATVTVYNAGAYPGPTSLTPTTVGPSGAAVSGGTGTGATFNPAYTALSVSVVSPGNGYTNGATVIDQYFSAGIWHNLTVFTIQTSGSIIGTAIAVYAGRVWIANGRAVSFTNANAYNQYTVSGSSFVIEDDYMHASITVLFAANNYLYIFGQDSIDVLSNVTVTNGIVSFTRVNVTPSVGTSQPSSIFGFFRSIAFANSQGFFLLTGATPDEMSKSIVQLTEAINQAVPIYGGAVSVKGKLCAAFLFSFADTFTVVGPTTRSMLALFFNGKWWFASPGGFSFGAAVFYPIGDQPTCFAWLNNNLYQLFNGIQPSWLIKTKLWDVGSTLTQKQSINAALGVNITSTAVLNVYADTEYNTVTTKVKLQYISIVWQNNASVIVGWSNASANLASWTGSPPGYALALGATNQGGGQYLGLTIAGDNNVSVVRLLALLSKEGRDILQ